jgi:hypothetical protein
MTSFNIILSSSASRDIYQENTLTRFTNLFPRNIKLIDSKWKIALQSICVGTQFSNVPLDVRNTDKAHMLIWIGTNYQDLKPPSFSLTIPTQFYSLQSLRDYFNEKIPAFLEENDIVSSVSFETAKEDANVLILNKRFCTIGLRQDLCEWLGFKTALSVNDEEYEEFEFARIFSPYQDYVIFGKVDRITNLKKPIGEAIVPKVIKVEISDLSQHFKSFKYNKILSLISYKHERESNVFHHIVKRKEYFNLNKSDIQNLSVRLLDQDDRELQLFGEQATLLNIIVRKMKCVSFMMRITSQECLSLFPDNTRSNFRSQLLEAVDLSKGQWEVALSSIRLPASIDVKDMLSRENFWIEVNAVNNWPVNRRIHFEQNNINNLKDLKEAINARMKDEIGDAKFFLDYTYDKRTAIRCFQPMSFTMSALLNYVLGRSSAEKVIVASPKTLFSAREADMERCKPNVGFLHCDFISPSIVGNKYAKVLKMIPLISASNTIECQHLDFMTVNVNQLGSMHFYLTDDNGKIIKFSNQNSDDILLNLVFEQNRK